jgi:predicted RNase H-like HicB family nuclease
MTRSTEYLKRPYGRMVVPESDGSFRSEIVEFPGCFAVGDTAAEALTNLERVAESWLDATIAKGQRIPEPLDNSGFSGKLVVRLPRTLHKRATYTAANEGVSLNAFIVSCIAEHVGAKTVAHILGSVSMTGFSGTTNIYVQPPGNPFVGATGKLKKIEAPRKASELF